MEKFCKICSKKTEVGFNIDFKLVPICESCATAIFIQQANWYSRWGHRIQEKNNDVNQNWADK